MSTYLIVDSMNLFMRVKNVTTRGDIDMRIGMTLHVWFSSLYAAWSKFGADHIVLCLEGRNNWRKTAYEPYKANRTVALAKRSQREIEDDEMFFEAFWDLIEFFITKTNCSVLQNDNVEADDLIATWVAQHPNDKNIIVSTDSDFVQLLNDHVEIYNGVTEVHFTKDAAYDSKGKNLEFRVESNTKLKVVGPNQDFKIDDDWREFQLFLKCVRGDTGDNIFPAYPGARLKGSKNKIGIREAFDDRNAQGFNYNNFMLQTWEDHNDEVHQVRDDFLRNAELIDLTKQPDDIKESCEATINTVINSKHIPQVGIHFMRFCGKWDLKKLAAAPDGFAKMLNSSIDNIRRDNSVLVERRENLDDEPIHSAD